MKHRLNLDIKDSNYTLLKEIFKIMDSRKTFEILTSFGFKNLNKYLFLKSYLTLSKTLLIFKILLSVVIPN